ncbi:efflux RND transporter periplasmic adaptor subunit [Stenoxybacter acetivorans]|uniref:efflux RND transporter periplasmic adaptor subunit n=1 Tax=Stenoxybacter acetivorans TaxID=422441 RepID=UPI00056C2688|nr:efflux RND transporter periplasmic adaptor subunit [Stenoxybacter acetivorans]
MKKWLKWLLWAAAACVLAGVLWWWLQPKSVMNYVTDKVRKDSIAQTVNATGDIAAAQLVDVGAQASGQIKKLHVTLGQQIKKGDLIAEIDSTTQLNTLNTNKARLDTYQAQLVSAQVRLQTAARALQREQILWGQDATSKQELENAEDTHAAAKSSVAELKSQIRQTQIAINTSEADLGYTRIISPMDGTVVSIPVEEGQTVNANQSTPTIVQVADLSQMLNKMQIAEGDITKVKAGMPLTFTILSDTEHPRKAKLDVIDPGLTTMSQGSYTTRTDTTSSAIYYYARALVPNEDGKLHIGMTTQNSILINQANDVLTVSNQAIKRRDGKKTVQVFDPVKKQTREVEINTGITDGMRTEVKTGLKAGEQVVLSEMSAEDAAKSGNVQVRGPRM